MLFLAGFPRTAVGYRCRLLRTHSPTTRAQFHKSAARLYRFASVCRAMGDAACVSAPPDGIPPANGCLSANARLPARAGVRAVSLYILPGDPKLQRCRIGRAEVEPERFPLTGCQVGLGGSSVTRRLQFKKAGIPAAMRHQLIVRAFFVDLSAFQHHDAVRFANRGEAMRNQQSHLAARE